LERQQLWTFLKVRMLLSCCFREPSKTNTKKKTKKNGKYQKIKENEECNAKARISAPISSTATKAVYSQGSKTPKYKVIKEAPVPSSTEICRIPSRVVPDFLPKQDLDDRTSFSKSLQNHSCENAIDSSEINVQNVALANPLPKDLSRMFASAEDLDGSNFSISDLKRLSSNISVVSNSTSQIENKINSNSLSHEDKTSSKNCKIIPQRNSIIENEKGNCRSILVQNDLELQIRNEGQVGRDDDTEDLHSKIREEYEKNIENLKNHHRITLENERETFHQMILEDRENFKKNLEKAKAKAKQEANETVCQLNKQIILERAKMFAEHQENSKNLEEEFRMKEDRLNKSLNLLNQSLNLIEEREQAWQDERREVLKEVQRLNEEASRMAKMLAMEYTEDNLSKGKRTSLSQEISSLQLVVEMRTGEVKTLREQLARKNQEQEQAEIVKEKLRNATLRMEDLEEQIKIKNRKEMQLSAETTKLELNMSNTSKEVDRMKKNVESMQWRIRNKFDLPVDHLTPVTSEQQTEDLLRTSLPTFQADQERSFKSFASMRPQSTPLTDKQFEFKETKTSALVVGSEVITTNTKVINSEGRQAIKSDLSPCSDGYNSSFTDNEHNLEKDEELDLDKETFELIEIEEEVDDLNKDADSLDEGVEDISSDHDYLNSPSFETEHRQISSNTSQVQMRTNSDRKRNDFSPTKNLQKLSPEKERMPSRFSFGV